MATIVRRKSNERKASKGLDTLLLEGGFVTKEQLEAASQAARQSNKDLRQVLLEQDLVSQETLAMVLSFQFNVPTVDLKEAHVQPAALQMISEDVARRYGILPMAVEGDTLTVATFEPDNVRLIETLSSLTKKKVKPVIPLNGSIREAIDSRYRVTTRVEKEIRHLLGAVRGSDISDQPLTLDAVSNAPVVKAVEMLLAQAVRDRASDIHIVPQEYDVLIRYRIDGIMHDAVVLPHEVHSALITRIKVMANMNIAERRRAQDGQFSANVQGNSVDFRVATIGTNHGEMAVLRVLDKSLSLIDLADLGMAGHMMEAYRKCLDSPFGMIMISGPTGSGKTTSLYASLSKLRSDELNVMTIEDPVEYDFGGVHQIQVNRAAEITFASGLRAIMRLDPDVILVGEVRDAETASTAIQAALTGHLVLTSIHANDAAGAIVRLLDFGVEPYLVTSAVIAALSQRLMRKVCPRCTEMKQAPVVQAMAYQDEMEEERTEFAQGAGCSYCSHTGFRGRVGAFEMIVMNDTIRQMVARGAGAFEVKQQAMNDGLVSMRRDGMMKVRDGITTPGEVIRNVFTIA
ncbi:MAG: ATPase, T2SS/T4P/T4SS family [Chloroflexota bacterium]|nr:ATPase, T2SS/T4P/T4SS family [Chloroflexota bacterium]